MKTQKQNIAIFQKIDMFLKAKNIDCADSAIFRFKDDRNNGIVFDLPRHLKGLIYSQLSNQQKWSTIEPKLAMVDEVFFNYDISLIKQHDGRYFSDKIKSIKCGNRIISKQMNNLHYNISVLESIENNEGGLDEYYNITPARELIKQLSASNGKYKLKYVGVALACEYLGNIGIDRIKPDGQIKRIMGANRLGYSKKAEATENDVLFAGAEIAQHTGLSLSMVDALLWSLCIEDKGNVCTKIPNCHICPVIEYCNKIK